MPSKWLAAAVVAVAGFASGTPAAHAGQCVTPAPALSRLWDQPSGGWIGGDGAFTVGAGRGRVLWIFGDSLIERDGAMWMVRNVALLQRPDGTLSMLAPSAATQEPFVSLPASGGNWLWPGVAVRVDNRIWLFLSEMRPAGSGVFGFEFVRTWLAEISAGSLTVASLVPVGRGSEIAWGAAVVTTRRHVYVFGIHNHPGAKYVHLARAPRVTWPHERWSYFNGGSWGPSPRLSGHIVHDAASQISVLRVKGGFALLTHDPWMGPYLRYRRARALTGPWTDARTIFEIPTPKGTFTYNTLAHPGFGDRRLLVSWNTGVTGGAWWPDDLTLTRPRFAWIAWSCLGGRP